MSKKACHSELVAETNKGGESLPLARTSSLATPSSGGIRNKSERMQFQAHPRNAPDSTPIEAPYELPDGWKWIPLLKSFENKTSSNKKLPTKDYSDAGKYAIIDQGQEFIGGYSDKTDFVFDGELPIIVFGDHTKCIKYIDFPFIQGADGVKILKPISIVDSKYFYYALKNIHFPDLGYRRHFPIFKDYQFPLPPTLAEQQRIVNRIETMFAKLDQAQEKAQSVLDSFETRKAAILHKAFTGELTAKWRKENGVPDDSWENKLFQELIIGTPQNGMYKSKDYYGNGTKILRIDCFYDGSIVSWDLLKRLQISDDELETYHLDLNDIVINRVNSMPYLGKSALIRELPENCVFESNMMRIKLNKSLLQPEFIIRFLNSTKGLSELRKNAKQAVNQASINQQDVKNVVVPVPSLAEQQEIVRILDTVLGKESRAKEAAQTVLDQITLLKKSILARAFRGEL